MPGGYGRLASPADASPPAPQPVVDAQHIAAAVRIGCVYLMTHDGGFPIGQKVPFHWTFGPATQRASRNSDAGPARPHVTVGPIGDHTLCAVTNDLRVCARLARP